jgi:transcription antitermination factor NusG
LSKRYDSTKQWYAIHTYSGYEEKVAESIRQRAESLDMGDKIFQVLVPKEKMIEIKNGKRKVVEKRKFDYRVGEVVNIVDGPFKGFDGAINEIDAQKGKLKVLVNMFGRETPVELDGLQVKRV